MLRLRRWGVLAAALVLPLAFVQLVGCAGADGADGGEAEPVETSQSAEAEAEAGSETAAEPDAEAESDAPATPTDVARPSTTGALHVDGAHLVGEDGEPVTLFGVSTHGLAWFPQYVNAELFQELSGWGANVMRLALYTDESGGWCTDGDREKLRQLVLDGVDFATSADQYVIVDWHILHDNDPWQHADEAKAFFADVTSELGDRKNVIYEVCNEPNGATTWEDVRAYAKEVIPVIRANDPDAVIIVGTPEWSQRVDAAAADPLDEPNVMYALHYYAATHKDDLRNRMVDAVQAGLPVFVSEFGICDASGNGAIDEAEADRWLATMDELGISRVMWNLSNKAESSAMLVTTCSKASGLGDADLSQAGRWLKARLAGEWETLEVALSQETAGVATPDASSAEAVTFTQGSLTVTVRLVNSWPVDNGTCYQYSLGIVNEGEACDGWHVDVPFAGEVALVDGWNATYEAGANVVHLSNESYNAHLEAGQNVTDVGFQVSGPGAGSIVP